MARFEDDGGSTSPGRRGRRWLVAALLTVVFAVLVGRETSAGEIAARLREFPATSLLAALGWLALAGGARAARLQLLLRRRLRFVDAYAFNQIYNLVTATVPTGLGEAASAWVMRRSLRVPMHLGLVALVVGRFLDLLVLLVLFLGVVATRAPRLEGGGPVVAAAAALCAALVVVAAIHLATRGRVAAALIARAAGSPGDDGRRRGLRRAGALLAEGIHLLPHGRRALAVLILTFATQLPSLAALHALLHGARLPLPYTAAILCFVFYVLLRMLPLQGIAGIGTTAAWWAIALSTLGVPPGEAALVGTVLYVAFFVLLIVLCLACLPLLASSRRDDRIAAS